MNGTNLSEAKARRRATSVKAARDRPVDLRFSLVGGAVAAVALFTGIAVVGRVSPYEGLSLVTSVLDTTRFFTAAVMTAGTTILALMLTVLGLTLSTRWQFRDVHYRRIAQVSLLASVAIVLSVVELLFMGLPLDEAEHLRLYHNIVYYGLMAATAVLGGVMIAIVLMLHRTIAGLVAIGHPTAESELIDGGEPARVPIDCP